MCHHISTGLYLQSDDVVFKHRHSSHYNWCFPGNNTESYEVPLLENPHDSFLNDILHRKHVASGDFNCAKCNNQVLLSYKFWGISVSCYVSLLPPDATHTLTPHPILRERLITYSFVSSFPQGLHDLNVQLRQGRPCVQPRALMTIFGRSMGCSLRPVMSLDPKFWWYIIRRFGSFWGTILVITCCRNRCPIASRNFFVWQVSLQVNL